MGKETLHIVKVGGQVLESEARLLTLLRHFAALPHPRLLVHGGGRRASEMSRRLGIEPQMHEGRRITDAASLEVAVMVYAGLANKQIVARLQALGCNALGLTGADGDAIHAGRRPAGEVDFGYVGDIESVNTDLLEALLRAGALPVFCAITHDRRGQLLNTNADTVAARLAAALSARYAVRLNYCFERPGVLRDAGDDRSLIPRITRAEYLAYRQAGIIHSGMLPKLDNAFAALAAGVHSVRIGNAEGLGKEHGTELLP